MRLIQFQQPKLHATSWLGTFLVGEEYPFKFHTTTCFSLINRLLY